MPFFWVWLVCLLKWWFTFGRAEAQVESRQSTRSCQVMVEVMLYVCVCVCVCVCVHVCISTAVRVQNSSSLLFIAGLKKILPRYHVTRQLSKWSPSSDKMIRKTRHFHSLCCPYKCSAWNCESAGTTYSGEEEWAPGLRTLHGCYVRATRFCN